MSCQRDVPRSDEINGGVIGHGGQRLKIFSPIR
jgi:hypothetical protein